MAECTNSIIFLPTGTASIPSSIRAWAVAGLVERVALEALDAGRQLRGQRQQQRRQQRRGHHLDRLLLGSGRPATAALRPRGRHRGTKFDLKLRRRCLALPPSSFSFLGSGPFAIHEEALRFFSPLSYRISPAP